jgi:GH15 family glucan-1,4-alpha-glucosidase
LPSIARSSCARNEGPVGRWRRIRDEIHAEVCREAWDDQLGSFTQSYGGSQLDASLLRLPLVGFLPPEDPRVRGTVAAVQRQLSWEGKLLRYRPAEPIDGLPRGEGAFLPCSFWLVDALALDGRHCARQQRPGPGERRQRPGTPLAGARRVIAPRDSDDGP